MKEGSVQLQLFLTVVLRIFVIDSVVVSVIFIYVKLSRL